MLALSGCGLAPAAPLGAAATAADVDAEARRGFQFGLGADVSQDPGVRDDESLDAAPLEADFNVMSALPAVVNLRDQCSPVANQGKFGSCTSFATVKGLQEFLLKQRGRYEPQSANFIWWETKRSIGKRGQDSGAPTQQAVKMLDNLGTPPEEAFPYLSPDLQKDEEARAEFLGRQPSPQIVELAKRNRIVTGMKLTDKLSGVRRGLASGMPVLLSMLVFESMQRTGKDGLLPMPKRGEKLLGGHAVLAVGYDNRRGVLIARNSWGPGWGDGGYFYIPYDYVRAGAVRLAMIPKVE